MAASREELSIYGFWREFHNQQNIKLPPSDIIQAFVPWLELIDYFDKVTIHENIQFENQSLTKIARPKRDGHWASAFGTLIVERGYKASWKMKIKAKDWLILIGIMDNELVESRTNVSNFFTDDNEGYGVIACGWFYYHGRNSPDGDIEHYANQFNLTGEYITITMELDMTQTTSDQGILKYVIHHETKQDVKSIRTDDKYTNIAYKTVDINRKYRAAVSLADPTDSVEFLE